MAKYICFYLHSRKIQLEEELVQGQSVTLSLKSNNELYFDKGASVVFYNWTYNKKYFFEAIGSIVSMGIKEKTNKYFLYKIEIKVSLILKENNSLEELVYSLRKIYRYNNPQRHFARSYTYLEKIDYETIAAGRIFLTRTIFGKIINSLPDIHIIRYLNYLINNQQVNFFTNRNYNIAVDMLRDYIVNNIEGNGRLLINSEALLLSNFEEIEITEIGFTEEGSSIVDNLYTQSRIFRELFASLKESNIWDLISTQRERMSDQEEIYQHSFEDINWPIDWESK